MEGAGLLQMKREAGVSLFGARLVTACLDLFQDSEQRKRRTLFLLLFHTQTKKCFRGSHTSQLPLLVWQLNVFINRKAGNKFDLLPQSLKEAEEFHHQLAEF